MALAIAVVGVAGVLAFSVSARTREFGIRLAIGSQPRHLLARVIAEGTVITAAGSARGGVRRSALQRLAGSYFETRAHAGGVGGARRGGRFAGGGGGRVGVARAARRARGCDSGAARGLAGGQSIQQPPAGFRHFRDRLLKGCCVGLRRFVEAR